MVKFFTYIVLSALLFSCNTYAPTAYRKEFVRAEDGVMPGRSSLQSINQDEGKNRQRVVIYHATLRLTVKNPDSANVRISEIAERYNGYVQTLGNRQSVIRVKADKLKDAIADIAKAGKLKDKVISGNDVTAEYVDKQIRLENAQKARARYLELLAKAENVEAALKVEKELERLNGEMELLEGRLKQLGHLAEFSTIVINIDEKVKPGVLGYVFIGLYEGVKWLFVRN